MKLLTGLALLFGVGVVVNKVSQGKKFLDQLTWTFNSAKIDFDESAASGFDNIYLTLNVSFSNNTDFAVTVNALVCDVTYNGYPVGSINDAIPFDVTAHTPTNLELPVAIQVNQASVVIEQLINDLQDRTKIIQFNFKGHIQTIAGNIPFNETKILI